MLARVIIVCGLALLASLLVVRTAFTAAFLEEHTALAERVWTNHPQVNLALAMAEIGQAAATGKTAVPASALQHSERAARAAPFAVEPFLIKGALAKIEGREDLAEQLFVEAQKRDPRSAAARYFLAERYLVTDRANEGLNEISALARLVPGGSQLLVPGLVQYARTPGAAPHLQKMFVANPEVGQAVLAELASDAANADLVMRIADPQLIDAGAPASAWQGRLLNSLIERQEFVRAQGLWSRFSGIRLPTPSGLVNKDFAKINAPPPFNWTFGSGSFGVAEPGAGGTLNVIFYGREDADLASQLLLLSPAQYRISMVASGDAEGASGLEWSVTCLPSKAKLASIPFKDATLTGRMLGGSFIVPRQGCAAQWLKLTGVAKEFAKSEQATIGKFDLSPVGGR